MNSLSSLFVTGPWLTYSSENRKRVSRSKPSRWQRASKSWEKGGKKDYRFQLITSFGSKSQSCLTPVNLALVLFNLVCQVWIKTQFLTKNFRLNFFHNFWGIFPFRCVQEFDLKSTTWGELLYKKHTWHALSLFWDKWSWCLAAVWMIPSTAVTASTAPALSIITILLVWKR